MNHPTDHSLFGLGPGLPGYDLLKVYLQPQVVCPISSINSTTHWTIDIAPKKSMAPPRHSHGCLGFVMAPKIEIGDPHLLSLQCVYVVGGCFLLVVFELACLEPSQPPKKKKTFLILGRTVSQVSFSKELQMSKKNTWQFSTWPDLGIVTTYVARTQPALWRWPLKRLGIKRSLLGSRELRKKPSYFPLYWLVYRDPCIGLWKSPYNWVV